MDSYYVATFYSTNYALKCERLLKNKDIDIKLIPVPRQVSSNCGLAARLTPQNLPDFMELYKEGLVEVEGLYSVEQEGKKLSFTLLEQE